MSEHVEVTQADLNVLADVFDAIGWRDTSAALRAGFGPDENDPDLFAAVQSVARHRRGAMEEAAKEELKAATGTLAEAIKDLQRGGFHDAAELLERKTMPETVGIFERAIRKAGGIDG